ncbi:TRAP transporter substrate-binding protein [Bacillus tamaricis]|uniref:TRAP transporter substrate-binding protein n=2 Tax=Evansella tamaricis TaxID=2069301 RepID=A0ABS6JD91_9BACI|nr:TRAP transporter substrate-binding protein [Evansella tamaricis]
MKLILLIVTALLLSVALIACSNDSDSDSDSDSAAGSEANGSETNDDSTNDNANTDVEEKVLKVAFNQPESHPQYKAMEALGEKFAERTNGAYKIEMYPNELLGAQRETIELVQSDTIAMSIVAGSLMENFNPDFTVFNLPYVYDSKDHQMKVLNDEDITGDLFKSTEGQGMLVMGAFHGGIRNVYNNKQPINTPEDLAGLKIRIMESDTNIQMMQLMGGVGTPMGQGEVYTAIQSGVLEGGENNELIYADLNHVEVAGYYSYTQHLMIPDYLIISAELFNGMSEEHQQIFKEELVAAIDLEVKLWDEGVEAAKIRAEEAGGVFNDVDISIFQEAVAPLIKEKVVGETAEELYRKVREAAAN